MTKPFTDELIEALFNLSRQMKEKMSYSSAFANLSFVQLQTLLFIKKQGMVQMSEIAQQFKIELPSATSMINKLSLLKLVQRKADKHDRRVVRIQLTAKGNELMEQAMKQRHKTVKAVLSHLTDSDKNDLLRIAKTLSGKMETL